MRQPATAGNMFAFKGTKSDKGGEKLSALKAFASDQLTLISQNEHKTQMLDMLSFDRADKPNNARDNQYEYLDANMHPTNMKKARSQHGQARSVKSNWSKPDNRSVLQGKSAKEKLQDQMTQGSSGFHNKKPFTSLKDEVNEQRPYAKNMAKQTLVRAVRDKLRKELWYMFRSAEQAYASFDFSGVGFITEKGFLESKLVQNRIPFSQEEIKLFFRDQNIFNSQKEGVDFDSFKKYFFPHLYLVQEDPDDADDKAAYLNKRELLDNKDQQSKVIEKRLIKLETRLKTKFSNCFESVRKAFLALDSDYDGYITVEDILKYFGNETDLNFNDLKKLIVDKDHKREGRLGYMDFSKWLGNAIHMSEGFYFRHDSIKNPQYDRYLQQQDAAKANDVHTAQLALMGGGDLARLEYQILEKIKFQWKTLRKAFMDLNIEKTGKISRREFKFYLNFWGMEVSEVEFNHVFSKFDLDQDGLISYKDFQLSIGSEMFPAEGLYFRQDKPQQCKINCCQHEECWQPTKNNQNFCVLHQKMHQDQAIQIFSKLFRKIAHNWKVFIADVKNAADQEDQSQIPFFEFLRVCTHHNARLSKDEQDYLIQAFPGMEGGSDQRVRMNVARLYDQKYNLILDRMYNKVDVTNFEGIDEPMDVNGYLGKTKFYRPQIKTGSITAKEFISIIHESNQLQEVQRTILEIDKDHNGYVTSTEMDDILKLYHQKLEDYELLPIIKKFSSIQNKILIDYKGFMDWIKIECKKRDAIQNTKPDAESVADKKSQRSDLKNKLRQLERKMEEVKKKEQQIGDELNEYADVYNNKSKTESLASRKLTSQNLSRLGDHTRNNIQSSFNAYNNTANDASRFTGSSVSPNHFSSMKEKMNTIRSQRPITSQINSRKSSKANNTEKHLSFRRRNSDEALENYDTDQQKDKLVVIADLMKKKQKNEVIKIGTIDEEPNNASLDNIKQYFSNQKIKQDDYSLNRKINHYIQKSLSPTREQNEDELRDQVGPSLVKTDGKTLKKIINFVSDMNYKFEDHSPEPMMKKSKSNNNFDKLVVDKMYHTLTDGNNFRVTHNQSSNNYTDKTVGTTKASDKSNSVFTKTKFQKQMIHKLAYEWKNIYRILSGIDIKGLGVVQIDDFTNTCDKCGVSIIPLEVKQLMKLYRVGSDKSDMDRLNIAYDSVEAHALINYKRLSIGLGIHKDSFNYLNRVQSMNRIQNINKLRQLYHSNNEKDDDFGFSKNNAVNYKSTNGLFTNKTNQPIGGADENKSRLQYNNVISSHNTQKRLKSSIVGKRRVGDYQEGKQSGNDYKEKLQIRYNNVRQVGASQTINVNESKNARHAVALKEQISFMNKRNSQADAKGSHHMASQNDYVQRLAEQLMTKPQHKGGAIDVSGSTAPASDQFDFAGGVMHRPNSQMTSIYNYDNMTPVVKFTDDESITKILKNKQKLRALREMVILHIKKNDLSTKIISDDFEKMSNDIILPLNSFKQCLQVVGIHLTPQQLQKYSVKGEITLKNKRDNKHEPTARSQLEAAQYNNQDSRNSRNIKSGNTAIRAKVGALLTDTGSMSLGYNVHKFLQKYL